MTTISVINVLKKLGYYGIHNHTLWSNTRFCDAINTVKALIYNAWKKGLRGINISDHQSLVAHFIAQKAIEELKKEHPHMFDNFKVTYGDEIYLVSRPTINKARKAYKAYKNADPSKRGKFPYTNFYHFVLTARNAHGYQLLLKLNAKAWKDSFTFGRFNPQRRLPTYKDWLAQQMKNYKGDIIASTACLGSELSQDILKLNPKYNNDDETKRAKKDIKTFIKYLIRTFGKDNVYFELMPSRKTQQKVVNKALVKLSQKTGIRTIISTDSHYTDFRNEHLHQAFLHAESETRDVYDFYHYAKLFKPSELVKFFDAKVLIKSVKNSNALLKTIKPFNVWNVKRTPTENKVLRLTCDKAKAINAKTYKHMIGIEKNIYYSSKKLVNSIA